MLLSQRTVVINKLLELLYKGIDIDHESASFRVDRMVTSVERRSAEE